MTLNFLNRILTSIIMLAILFIFLFFNKYLWLYLLIVISFISFHEFRTLIKKIYRKKIKTINFYLFLTLIYLCFFTYAAYEYFTSLSLLIILSVCILSDTGGYLFGKLIGGKKLTKISPNKTISGSIGSFLSSLFTIIIFENLQQEISISIFICLFLSLICQLGDLFISFFKRKARVKDTGSFLPGHGGLLDRIDGLIFVLPIAFIIEKVFS